jgi:hypothetical protein
MTDWFYWSNERIREALRALRGRFFDLILANDLDALPVALEVAHGSPVVFDAHEYAPLEFEDSFIWRFFFAAYKDQMCRRFMPRATMAITVSEGIAERYASEYSVRPEVITNAAPVYDLPVRPTDAAQIRIIYHGAAIASRRLEWMIDLMDLLDRRYSLDLILVPGDRRYIEYVRRRAAGKPSVRFLAPVPMAELVSLSSNYDVGLYLLPPSSFNNRMALPNKFFEFLQARLAIAIGPSFEMAKVVRAFSCGVVAPEFSVQALATSLNGLTCEDIDRMKAGADRAARILTAERNDEKLRSMVSALLHGTR